MSEFEAVLWNLRHYEVDEAGCWNWTRSVDRDGYGRFAICERDWRAHRAAYMVHVGDLDPEKVVMHICDNRACIRPDHLRLGTQAENIADAVAKGRMTGRPRKVRTILIKDSGSAPQAGVLT